MVRRLIALSLLAAVAIAAPAAAHDDGAVTLPERIVDGAVAELHGDRIPPGADVQLRAAATRRALTRVAALDATTPTLADTWCGTPRSSDDTANASTSAGAAIKVVYAYPSDVTNLFASRADLIQQDARDISASFALAAAATKTVRFDVGTSCGARYLDIASIALPRTRATYLGMSLNARVSALQSDLAGFAAGLGGTHDILVYLENLYAGDGVSGVATLYDDDRPGSVNLSNRGGQFAFVLGGLTSSSRRTTAQHELGHNLGAVQDSAPHSTQAGHCFERYDVMCYADGGPRGGTSDLVYPADCASAASPAWDCDGGDYFDPAPPAGSYLAAHWNLFDSVYLCAPPSCFTDRSETGSEATGAGSGASGGGGSSAGAGTGSSGASAGTGDAGGSGSSGDAGGTSSGSSAPVPPPRVVVSGTEAATAEHVRDALDAVQDRFPEAAALRALRTGRAVRVRITAPSSGTLTARLVVAGRTVLRATVALRDGQPATIALRPTVAARRALRHARSGQLALRLTLR